MAGGKVPQVAFFEVVDVHPAFKIKCRDPDSAFYNICPFSFLVPVEFSNDALFQAHVHASKLNAS